MLNCGFSVAGMFLATTASRRLAVAAGAGQSEPAKMSQLRVQVQHLFLAVFTSVIIGNFRYLLVPTTNRLLGFLLRWLTETDPAAEWRAHLFKLITVLFSSTLSTCTNDIQHLLLTRWPQRWWTLHDANETSWLHIVERWTEHTERAATGGV